jgi:seryl-tRNA(Sec) selenium transferase
VASGEEILLVNDNSDSLVSMHLRRAQRSEVIISPVNEICDHAFAASSPTRSRSGEPFET